MKCPICKYGSIHKGYASIILERDGTTLFFKNVPADICDNCGEIYHDEEATDHCWSKLNRRQPRVLNWT